MHFNVLDVETRLLTAGLNVPPLVSVASARVDRVEGTRLARADVTLTSGRHDNLKHALDILNNDNGDCFLVGHNVAFDLAVIATYLPETWPHVWQAVEDRRVIDTLVADKLFRIRQGTHKHHKYSLAKLVERWLGIDLSAEKDGDVRTSYADVEGLPLDQWPQAYIDYAKDDVVHTANMFKRLIVDGGFRSRAVFEELRRQSRANFDLRLMSFWGLRTDGPYAETLEERFRWHFDELRDLPISEGLIRPNGTKDMAAIRERVERCYTLGVERTKTGQVSTSRDVLLNSGDPALEALGNLSAVEKVLSNFIPILRGGAEAPVHTYFNVLVESGRTSSRRPNLQNIKRDGGIREAFVARDGCIFIGADYSTLELRTFAQVQLEWFGQSEMADAVRQGKDLHLEFAASLAGVTYQEACDLYFGGDKEMKRLRSLSKVANFGYAGGLGARTFVTYAKGMGVVVSETEARHLRTQWLRKWRTADKYLKRIGHKANRAHGDRFSMTQGLEGGRERGGCTYTSGANTMFQGLAADGAKEAAALIVSECYNDPGSVLYGCRPVLAIHDEFCLEAPDDPELTLPRALRLCHLMEAGMEVACPDVPIVAEPFVMRRWSKDAGFEFDDNLRIKPWDFNDEHIVA